MNKVQRVAGKVFTPEFLTLITSIPPQYIDNKNIEELMENMSKHLNKKRISDCLLALSNYLASIVAENEEELDATFGHMREEENDVKAERYIQ